MNGTAPLSIIVLSEGLELSSHSSTLLIYQMGNKLYSHSKTLISYGKFKDKVEGKDEKLKCLPQRLDQKS